MLAGHTHSWRKPQYRSAAPIRLHNFGLKRWRLDSPANCWGTGSSNTSNYFPIHSRLARRQTYAQQSRPRHIAQPARKDEVAQPASLKRPVSPVYERPVPCVQQLSCRRRQGCCGILCVAAPMKCSTGRRRRHDKRGAFHVRVTTLLT